MKLTAQDGSQILGHKILYCACNFSTCIIYSFILFIFPEQNGLIQGSIVVEAADPGTKGEIVIEYKFTGQVGAARISASGNIGSIKPQSRDRQEGGHWLFQMFFLE